MLQIDKSPQPIEKIKKPIVNMEAFRKEITEEIKHRNIDIEFGMNLNNLTESDALFWYKVKDCKKDSITFEDFTIYKKDVKDSGIIDREKFVGTIIGNRVHAIISKRELENMSKQNK